jgi:hypothetical protein
MVARPNAKRMSQYSRLKVEFGYPLTTPPYWFIGNNFLEIVNKLKRYSTTPITNTTCDVISCGIFQYMDR